MNDILRQLWLNGVLKPNLPLAEKAHKRGGGEVFSEGSRLHIFLVVVLLPSGNAGVHEGHGVLQVEAYRHLFQPQDSLLSLQLCQDILSELHTGHLHTFAPNQNMAQVLPADLFPQNSFGVALGIHARSENRKIKRKLSRPDTGKKQFKHLFLRKVSYS